MTITELSISDREQAAKYLQEFDLAYTDLNQPNIRIFKFEDSGRVVGFGGLEIYGALALLRSIIVEKESQGKKAGRFICQWIEDWARENHLSALYLLTTTAKDFFAHLNYRVIQQDEFPEPLKKTTQFSELCPASSVCMSKTL